MNAWLKPTVDALLVLSTLIRMNERGVPVFGRRTGVERDRDRARRTLMSSWVRWLAMTPPRKLVVSPRSDTRRGRTRRSAGRSQVPEDDEGSPLPPIGGVRAGADVVGPAPRRGPEDRQSSGPSRAPRRRLRPSHAHAVGRSGVGGRVETGGAERSLEARAGRGRARPAVVCSATAAEEALHVSHPDRRHGIRRTLAGARRRGGRRRSPGGAFAARPRGWSSSGDDPASRVYVRNKGGADGGGGDCASLEHRLPAETGQAELLALRRGAERRRRRRRHPGSSCRCRRRIDAQAG